MEQRIDYAQSSEELLITDPTEIGRITLELAMSGEAVDHTDDSFEDGPYSHLREQLQERIVGQEGAVDALIDALNDAEFSDPDKPIGTFLFLGPTGVGKSQLSAELATLIHGDTKKAYHKINCTQFKSYGDITLLQGAPLGYIGYGDSTLLDSKKLAVPKNVLVFDEIEKAHPAIHDFLMQILDEGEITLFTERNAVSLKECIVILTSNAGSGDINALLNKTSMGLRTSTDDAPRELSKEKLMDTAFEALEKIFRPEFIGRIENKILFTHLSDEHHSLALEQYVKEINTREPFQKRGISLEATDELREAIVKMTPRRSAGGVREVQNTFKKGVEREFVRHVRAGRIPNHSVAYATPASEATREKNPHAIAEFRAKRLSV